MSPNSVRSIKIKRKFTRNSPGSVLYQCGDTIVLCTASLSTEIPRRLVGTGEGWLTAEYSMLPHSTNERKSRDRGQKADGRSIEIQRLIGRSLRAVVDLKRLGELNVHVDCDVLQADGGTRTASINGGFIALVDALHERFGKAPRGEHPIQDSVAAISVGIINGKPQLDLDYEKDYAAQVDMNVVMTGSGRFIEIQGTGEKSTFDDDQLAQLLKLARNGVRQLTEEQKKHLGRQWPL